MNDQSYEDPREVGDSFDSGSVLSFLIFIIVAGWFIMEYV